MSAAAKIDPDILKMTINLITKYKRLGHNDRETQAKLRKQTEIRLQEELVDPISGKSCSPLISDDETGNFKKRQSITTNRTLV